MIVTTSMKYRFGTKLDENIDISMNISLDPAIRDALTRNMFIKEHQHYSGL